MPKQTEALLGGSTNPERESVMKTKVNRRAPDCKNFKQCGSKATSIWATLCRSCFLDQAVRCGAKSSGNASGNPGNAGNANAKGSAGNAGNANAKGKHGNKGNVSKGATKKGGTVKNQLGRRQMSSSLLAASSARSGAHASKLIDCLP